ncbi:MAG TPA: HlyD family secretion protein [Terriglobia bacterium]|nr:HlyD family secretion protein [Terriglobia bacterium]
MGDDVVTENKAAGSPEPGQAVAASPSPAPNGRRSLKKLSVFALVLGIVSVVVVAAIFVSVWHKVSTDDAQVDAHITTVSTRVPGYVNEVAVNDNQYVKTGDLLLRIDPRDYQAALDQAQAAYDAALATARSAKVHVRLTRNVTSTSVEGSLAAKSASEATLLKSKESVEEAATAALAAGRANVAAKHAANARAQADLVRYRPLVKTDDVSALEFDAVQAAARVAQSELDLAQQQLAEAAEAVAIARAQEATAAAQLTGSEAQVRLSQAQLEQVPLEQAQYQSSLAAVERAKAGLEEAKLRLSYTEVVAPISGEVTQRTVQPGDYVAPGQLLLTIVPLDRVYVTANFKETQLAGIRPGDRAVIRADTYGGRKFQGVVDSIAGSTGSEQALLPPQNATGNFVKVVQRVPVKILVRQNPKSGAILRPGMNVEVTIHVR